MVSVDDTGLLWMRHDDKAYCIEMIGVGVFAKVEKDEYPQALAWYTLGEACDMVEAHTGFEDEWELIVEHMPKYKGGRNKSKWAATTTKSEWHDLVDKVTREIAETVGAAVVQVEKAEADDIMSEICRTKLDECTVCIVSMDGDMAQLQKYPGVIQYNNIKKEFVQVEDPKYGLLVKVLGGDSKDNVKSCKRPTPRKPTKKDPRETIIKPIGVKSAEELLLDGSASVYQLATDEGWVDQLEFNSRMIGLDNTPKELRKTIRKALADGLSYVKRVGRLDSFGIPMEDIRAMRAVASVKKVKFMGSGTAEDGTYVGE
jgi:hypothetical protein